MSEVKKLQFKTIKVRHLKVKKLRFTILKKRSLKLKVHCTSGAIDLEALQGFRSKANVFMPVNLAHGCIRNRYVCIFFP